MQVLLNCATQQVGCMLCWVWYLRLCITPARSHSGAPASPSTPPLGGTFTLWSPACINKPSQGLRAQLSLLQHPAGAQQCFRAVRGCRKTAKELLSITEKRRKRENLILCEMREGQKLFSALGWALESCFDTTPHHPYPRIIIHFSVKTPQEQLNLYNF